MVIDNFENIKPILNFNGELYVYVTLYNRKKDNPCMHDQMHAVKHYYIDSYKYLDKIKEEIITLCETFNARAYISYSMRRKDKFISAMLIEMSHIANNNFINTFNFSKLAQTSGNVFRKIKPLRKNSYHMIHCDGEYAITRVPQLIDIIKNAGAQEIYTIPSVTGVHILYKGADTSKINNVFDKMDETFHEHFERKGTDAYTLLYSNLKEIK